MHGGHQPEVNMRKRTTQFWDSNCKNYTDTVGSSKAMESMHVQYDVKEVRQQLDSGRQLLEWLWEDAYFTRS